jgi:two-component system cell cycle response regulator
MTGTILIADAVATRRIALRARLGGAFRRIVFAASGEEALAASTAEPSEVLLAASDLPDMPVAEMRRRLCDAARGVAAPALAVLTPDDDRAARLDALSAGADDAIARSTTAPLLLARLRRLLRDRDDSAELRLREATRRALGFAEPPAGFDRPARVALLAGRAGQAAALSAAFGARVRQVDRRGVLALGPNDRLDALVLADGGTTPGAAALVPALRAQRATRSAVLLVQTLGPGAEAEAAQALDMGAQDALAGPFDPEELALRLAARLAAKRRADRLRDDLHEGLDAAVTDPLTGLYNRRFALPELARLAEEARATGRSLAVLVADLDHFKAVNDAHGHAAGDAVLVETATRIRGLLGKDDIAARIGGEEFLIALPGADAAAAARTGRRLCRAIAEKPVALRGRPATVQVTVSVGIAAVPDAAGATPARSGAQCAEALLEQADRALYSAKARGRNRVSAHRSAA